jgi:glycosyltransferase involved in cell wall biosynthesis
MRITFVLPPLNHSGGIRVLSIYAAHLHRNGHKVTVVATRERRPSLLRRVVRVLRGKEPPPWRKRPPAADHFQKSPVEVRRLPHHGPVTDRDVPDADVIVATWWETAPMVWKMSPAKGKKAYFIQGHEGTIEHVNREEADATWRLPLQKIVVAEWLANMARDEFGDPTAVCVPNSVDMNLFHAPERGKRPVPMVGFIYMPVHNKGTDIAIEALKRAKQAVPELRALCFGYLPPGPELPIPDWCTFTLRPPQQTLRDLYGSCDAFLQPSRVEGFGLPILEAMACRTPVIATPAGAAPELLRSGGGKMVPHESPEQMAAAIVEVVTASESEWRRMSDAGYQTAKACSWEAAGAKFEAALMKIVQQRP